MMYYLFEQASSLLLEPYDMLDPSNVRFQSYIRDVGENDINDGGQAMSDVVMAKQNNLNITE